MGCCTPAPLSAEEQACLADTAAALMHTTATILRRVPADDMAGGQSVTWTAVASSVPCRASGVAGALGGGERDADGRWETAVSYRVSLPAGTDVRASDRIVIDGDVTVEVTAVLRRWTEIARTVDAVQVTP